jgi:hypothetical protein
MKSVKINTVQGIGDLMWVYRKLAPIYDKIHFNVMVVDHNPIQHRGEEFLKTLDKCSGVSFEQVSRLHYKVLAQDRGVIVDQPHYDYAINAWLEDGVHLDDIDSNPVLWDLNLGSKRVAGLPPDYLLVYISGNKGETGCGTQMDDKDWVELISMVARHKDFKTILFTGAKYDEQKMLGVISLLRKAGFNCHLMLTPIRETMFLIKNARFFVAYQSGLCMLSEELGTPTLMVWFPFLKKMQTTWIRKANIEKKLIKHCYFDMGVAEMFDQVK